MAGRETASKSPKRPFWAVFALPAGAAVGFPEVVAAWNRRPGLDLNPMQFLSESQVSRSSEDGRRASSRRPDFGGDTLEKLYKAAAQLSLS